MARPTGIDPNGPLEHGGQVAWLQGGSTGPPRTRVLLADGAVRGVRLQRARARLADAGVRSGQRGGSGFTSVV